jgi:protein-tyrosine phosphatase
MISDQIYNFMEQANERSESVLIHSVRGQSRAASVIAVYLMRKYKWTLLKTLEFLNSRRPDLEMRTTFIQQLTDYEQRLAARGMGA